MTIDPAASGPDTHLDPDLLADLAEGLLGEHAAEAARSHLASCTRCAEDYALITVDSGLATFLTSEPIPADVLARVEAALHREPPLTQPTPVRHAAPKPTLGRRFRLTFGALAGASLIVVGVVGGIAVLNSGGSESKSSTAASQYSGNAAAPGAGSASSGAAAPNVVGAPDLQAQARALVNQAKAQSAAGQSPLPGRPLTNADTAHQDSTRTPDSSAYTGCVPAGLAKATLLAHGPIQYQGRSAELLVYAVPGTSTEADVVVVPQTCASVPAAPGSTRQQLTGASPEVLATTEINLQ